MLPEKTSFVKMNIDQVNIHTFQTSNIGDVCDSKQILIHERNDIDYVNDTINKIAQIPDQKYIPGIFHTNKGYRGGYIISRIGNTYEILFTRDEFGGLIHEIGFLPVTCQVFPIRKHQNQVWIYTHSDIKAEGYIKVGESINTGFGIGSGVNSISDRRAAPSSSEINAKRKLAKYPIYHPLTFHNLHHRNTLTYASSFISQLIDEYFRHKIISNEILEQARWLVNVVLIVDNHTAIPRNVFLEALTNFCLDYMMSSPGTLIRQPINYIFDVLGIDGVYSKGHLSVSYISTDFEGVDYQADIE